MNIIHGHGKYQTLYLDMNMRVHTSATHCYGDLQMVYKNSIINDNPKVRHIHGELQTFFSMLLIFHHFIYIMGRSVICASLGVQNKIFYIRVTQIYPKCHHYLLMKIFYHLHTIIMSVILLVLVIHSPSMILRSISTTDHNKLN